MQQGNALFDIVNGLCKQVSRTKDIRKIDFLDNNNLIQLTASYIASYDGNTALKLTAINIHADHTYQRNALLNEGLIGLYSQFELVNIIDLKNDSARQIYSNTGFEKVYGTSGLRKGIEEFTVTEVFSDDQEKYRKFMNLDTFEERLKALDSNFMTEAFRLKDKNDDYSWKLVTILRNPSIEDSKYLYEIQYMNNMNIRK